MNSEQIDTAKEYLLTNKRDITREQRKYKGGGVKPDDFNPYTWRSYHWKWFLKNQKIKLR